MAAFASGRLPAAEVLWLERHLDACSRCAALLPVGARSGAQQQSAAPGGQLVLPLPPGASLGRYQVRRWIGRGGMGDVYEGFDPQLERAVALKLLHSAIAADARARDRLAREARAMARLSHPNVVTALDFGVSEERAFLVMELVDGVTLAEWLRPAARSWRQVLSAFIDAGEGLAAAHDVGIVHRDFKPQNVLVGQDGKVRVTDFGLARWKGGGAREASTGAREIPALYPAGTNPVTASAQPAGTPRYMSPEQRAGGAVDARSDQYSFCVALDEALSGAHPVTGAPPARAAARRGWGSRTADAAVGAGGHRVRRRVADAVRRGLSELPEGRFPSMRALLDHLRGGSRPARHALRWWAAATFLAAGALVVAWWGIARRPGPPLLVPEGTPADWSHAKVVARVPDRIYCLRRVDDRTVRFIWGTPRRAEDVSIDGSSRRPSPLVPEAYRHGCPEVSPDGRQLIFEGFDSAGRPHVFHANDPSGAGARPVVPSSPPSVMSEPQWLSSNSDFVFDLDWDHPAAFSLQTGAITAISKRARNGRSGFVRVVDPVTDKIMVLYSDDMGLYEMEGHVIRWPSLAQETEFRVVGMLTGGWRLDGRRSRIIGSLNGNEPNSVITEIDISRPRLMRVGSIPGYDVTKLEDMLGTSKALVASALATELWFLDAAGHEQRIRLDGACGDPSVDSSGKLLVLCAVGKEIEMVAIDPDTRRAEYTIVHRAVTDGVVLPSGDWLLARGGDDAGIDRCRRRSGDCRRIVAGAGVQLAASPDGHYLAFLVLRPRGMTAQMVSTSGGSVRDLAVGVTSCRPIWDGPSKLWISRRVKGAITWTELGLPGGQPTGRIHPGQSDCVWGGLDPARPIRGRGWNVPVQESEVRILPTSAP